MPLSFTVPFNLAVDVPTLVALKDRALGSTAEQAAVEKLPLLPVVMLVWIVVFARFVAYAR
jgi:hypothetical protein